MTRRIVYWLAPAAPFLLVSANAGSAPARSQQEHTPVEAHGRSDFFDRPVALAAARRSQLPYPLVVLRSTDPWRMVIGSDSPSFVLYSDGRVIYRATTGLKTVTLNPAERDALVQFFTAPKLAALAGNYEAAHATDQPDNDLLVYANGTPFYISVYGSLDSEKIRATLPGALLEAYDRLRHFSASAAQDWRPEKFEVMLWPYENAPDQSIVWPKNLPDLTDSVTRKRGESSYSVFVSSRELPAVQALLATQKEKGALEMNGRKWSAGIRMPFPHEALWMAPKTP